MVQEKIDYESIRSQKIKQYGTEFKDWIWILVKQYKDRTHFLFELLQNAEDANAREIKIYLYHDRLEISHDGILFSKEDVISITKVAKSTKMGTDNGNIGKFGIGFKSVYAYASTPRIYSGKYAFEIRDFIFPYEIEKISIRDWETKIIIPFDNGEIPEDKAYSEIRRVLHDQVSTNTILFLNNIDSVEIHIEDENDFIRITKEDAEIDFSGNVLSVDLLYSHINAMDVSIQEKEETYLLFTDCEEEAVKLAFKIEENAIIPINNTSFFTFFPTDKESHQAFYIHAPFDTTPARDNIVEDSERNVIFINNICEAICYAFCWMRDNGYLTISGLNATYPIYEYPKDSIFHKIYQTAIDLIMSEEKIIPTNQAGVFKSYTEILMPDNMSIVTVFVDEDIQVLFGNHRIFWLAKEISTDACQKFREFLKKNFAFKTYTWKDIVSRLDAQFLERKEKSWFEKLFFLIRSFAVTNPQQMGRHDIDVTDIPLVRLSNGKHICAYRDGITQVYLNNPQIYPNKIESEFRKNETIHNFYVQNLKIPIYDVCRIALDEILPKYVNRDHICFVTEDTRKENISDLKLLKDALITTPEILPDIMNAYILTDGNSWFKPEELHIPSGYAGSIPEYGLVRDVCNLKFISWESQTEPKLDEKFFMRIGCAGTLKKIEITEEDYLGYVYKYIGKKSSEEIRTKIFRKKYQHGFQWNMIYEGFPSVLEQMDEKKSFAVARFLNKNTTQFAISGDIAGAEDQSFSGSHVDNMVILSAMGILLSYIPWMYTMDGRKVAAQTIHRHELHPNYEKECRRLLDILPFLEEDNALKTILERIDDAEQRRILKSFITDHEKLAEVTKIIQKQELQQMKRIEKRSKTPQEILDEAAKKKSKGASNSNLPDADALTNLERRRKKLEEEFGKSMDFKVGVPKCSLKYTYQDRISPEEKTFLYEEYEGHCQICGLAIRKHNGSNHFMAINVIRTAELDDKYRPSLAIGWNSLSMCPNCAAKFLYGPKDISRFYQQVQEKEMEEHSEDYIEINISLQDKEEVIKYTPKHFLALQTALKVFME